MGDCACHEETLRDKNKLSFLFLELTPACNNRCIGCCNVFAARRMLSPLPAQEWKTLIANLASHVTGLKLSGGEPTLYSEFAEIISFIHTLGIPLRLLTNGRWPKPERVLSLLQPMASNVTLLVSLHGPDVFSHEAFSGVRGSFAETVINIQRATEAGLQVATSTVLTRYNWNRVEEMAAFAHSLGAIHAVFNRYIGPPLPSLEATPSQFTQAVRHVEALIAAEVPVRWGTPLPRCLSPRVNSNCLAGEAFATVDPWGNVRPCNHAPYVVGNLLAQSFEEVWRSPMMEKWRTISLSECTDCLVYENCHKGCRAEAILHRALKLPAIA